jgi:hypothetical protein
VNDTLSDYYRCPVASTNFTLSGPLSSNAGFFRWGAGTICYGRSASGRLATDPDSSLYDISGDVSFQKSSITLPFDPVEVTENLLHERYTAHFRQAGSLTNALVRKTYYLVRPLLGVSVRKHLQRVRLRNWKGIEFPEWPVDLTVDRLHRRLLELAMRSQGIEEMPFIWFWPEGFTSCAVITHDVEERGGRDFCGQLMNIDESYGFRSSFQVVPEGRYPVRPEYLSSLASRGFEVNVHDLRHDGRLFADHDEFLRRAGRINEYGRQFGALGFRSGILYRNADWYDALDFLYDMSIPNAAHLDPQRGGCCTVLPYFIGKIVELPVTCTQDYTLFHILGDYSIELWKRQIELIRENHGLVSILVHPDYLIEPRAQNTYKLLLEHLAELRDQDYIWTPLPRDVATWWKERSQMELVCEDGAWRIKGLGSERAFIAYARLEEEGVVYKLKPVRKEEGRSAARR